MSELDRSDLNVAFNTKIQFLFQQGITPVVEKGLFKSWGNDWTVELNERRRGKVDPKNPKYKPKPVDAIEINNGKPNWDTNKLLHTIREYNRDIANFSREESQKIFVWCKELLESRNAPAHFNVDSYHIVNTDRNVAYQATVAIKLLEAFRVHEEASQIRALIDGGWSSSRFDGSKAKGDKPDSASAPSQPQPVEVPPPSRHSTLPPAPSDVGQGHRRKPLPAPGPGVVVFPLIGHEGEPNEAQCLGSIAATLNPGDTANHVSFPTGLISGKTATFYQIIKDVRDNEPDSARLTEKTRIRFDPGEFLGESFGLAVAIADRTARYGLSQSLAGRMVIATGAVSPKRGGDIGAIDGLDEKIVIVQRFAPKGSLFIFPRENLDKANQTILDGLAKLKTRGIPWRAVSHIDELNDLLAISDEPVTETHVVGLAASASVSAPRAAAAERKPAKLPAATQKAVVRPPVLTRRLLASAALTGILILTAAYYMALWREAMQPDIAAVQASDERLQALSRAASSTRASVVTADNCTALVAASKTMSAGDVARFDDFQRRAALQARECTSLLAQSDDRLQAVFSAAGAAGTNEPASLVRLASTVKALLPFDLARERSSDLQAALDAGERAVSLVTESNERIATFNQLLAVWTADTSNGKAADEVASAYKALNTFDYTRPATDVARNEDKAQQLLAMLSDSTSRISQAILFISAMESKNTDGSRQAAEEKVRLLTDFDLSRATSLQRATIERGRDMPRLARWSAFESAARAFKANETPENTIRVAETFQALTTADRLVMSSELGPLRDIADRAQRAISESDARLAALQDRFSAVMTAQQKKKSLAGPSLQLVSVTSDLTDLDRLRLSEEQRSAVMQAAEISAEFKQSDKRISNALTWAEIALKAKGDTVPRSIMRKMRQARAGLTALDKERLSDEQKQMLKDVCGVSVEPQPGMLPAVAGFECYDESDFKPRMLPAITP